MMDPLARRVANRFAAESQLDEKMKALLLKLRKGADASLSLGQLFKVLALLGGWRVEEIVGLTKIHNEQHPHQLQIEEDEDRARKEYDRIKSFEVSSLPSSPKLGHFYVMGLEPFSSKPDNWKAERTWHGAKYLLWVGVPAFRVTDPHGKVFEIMPTRHDIQRGGSIREQEQGLPTVDAKGLKKRLQTYDVLPWLKKDTSYIAQINDLLGMEEHVPADKRTRENTGTCAVCFRNIKLVQKSSETTMALHGYNRPGYGWIVGKCWGGAHPPYELSCEATKLIFKDVQNQLDLQLKYLNSLSLGITEFDKHWGTGRPEEMVTKAEFEKYPGLWEREVKNYIKGVEYHVKGTTRQRNLYKWLIEKWEVHELPHEGDKQLDWFEIAARATQSEPM